MSALVSLGALLCGLEACTSSSSSCVADPSGNYVCNTYAPGYPYAYDYYLDSYYYAGAYDTFYSLVPGADAAAPVGDARAPADARAPEDARAPGDASGSDAGPPPTTNVPELLLAARRGGDMANAGVRAAIAPIQELVKTKPDRSGETLTYGPMDQGNASYRFLLRKLSGDGKQFGWRLEARPLSGDSFQLVAGGFITVSDTGVTRSALGVDGDALRAADSTQHIQGKLLLGASDDGTQNLLWFRLKSYTPDSTRVDPIDASAFGVRHDKESNDVRVVLRTNLAATTTPALETVAIQLRWRKADGARADAVAVGGDIPEGQEIRQSTCVPASLDPASASTSVTECDLSGQNCTSISGPSTIRCPAAFQTPDVPDVDPAAEDAPAGAPTLPTPPDTVPDGTTATLVDEVPTTPI